MKPGFHLWMLEPKSSQSSGCTYTYQTSWKTLNKRLPAKKLMATVFWDWKGVLIVEFMQRWATIVSDVYCKTLKKTAWGHSEQKAWNAGIWCMSSAPPWQCMSAYSSLHSSTAGIFQLGVVGSPSLQPCSHSEWLPPVYLPEELVWITTLQW
jgi:hypothetical protein